MSQYSSMTVVQLKEALKDKGLSVDGKKADLVARLTENSAAGSVGGELDDDDVPVTAVSDEKPLEAGEKVSGATKGGEVSAENEPEVAENGSEVAANGTEPAQNGTEPAQEKPKPKVLTADERKQLAVEVLTKKIKRAEKFGDEASATAAKKDLARVEKFGVDLGTALAKEIGLLDRNVNSELGSRKSHKKSRGKRVHK